MLGVAAPHRDPADHAIASVAAVLLALLTGEHRSGTGADRSAALVRLLLGAEAEAVAPLLGGERWLVVHARPDARAPDPVAASALGAALGSPLVDLAEDVVRVLLPAEREPAPQSGWTLGVSAAAGPREWPVADTQAARALARARATRTPLVRHAGRPALADLVPGAEAEAHARALLGPPSGSTPPSPTPCAPGCPCTAVGTARPSPCRCTATPSGSGSPGAPRCWGRTWTIRTYGWNCGSRCGGCDRASDPRPSVRDVGCGPGRVPHNKSHADTRDTQPRRARRAPREDPYRGRRRHTA
ncbi:hypothetical protein GCM10020295_53040 [Streptomyces cinereospinus]